MNQDALNAEILIFVMEKIRNRLHITFHDKVQQILSLTFKTFGVCSW